MKPTIDADTGKEVVLPPDKMATPLETKLLVSYLAEIGHPDNPDRYRLVTHEELNKMLGVADHRRKGWLAQAIRYLDMPDIHPRVASHVTREQRPERLWFGSVRGERVRY